ncbi:MAG: hypothetical protein KDD36_09615 [Flavobacteriales bacterium]|nr:hypothetical protein [Flavobacteriales bacterium]
MQVSWTSVFKLDAYSDELFTLIPEEVNGTPPTTGDGFWMVDNEMARVKGFPMRAFQNIKKANDTLYDYVLLDTGFNHVDLTRQYHPIYIDSVSGKYLLERNHFLSREKILEKNILIDGDHMYYDFYGGAIPGPVMVRFRGTLENMDIFKYVSIAIAVEDSVTHESDYLEAISIMQSSYMHPNGTIPFDVTMAVSKPPPSYIMKVFLYNEFMHPFKGNVTATIYRLGAINDTSDTKAPTTITQVSASLSP